MSNEILEAMIDKMEKSIEAYRRELTKVRTGRASLSLVDGLKGLLSPSIRWRP